MGSPNEQSELAPDEQPSEPAIVEYAYVPAGSIVRGWGDDASCRNVDPSIFFGQDGETGPEAIARHRLAVAMYCRLCPVALSCLSDALVNRQDDGVLGRTTPAERRQIIEITPKKGVVLPLLASEAAEVKANPQSIRAQNLVIDALLAEPTRRRREASKHEALAQGLILTDDDPTKKTAERILALLARNPDGYRNEKGVATILSDVFGEPLKVLAGILTSLEVTGRVKVVKVRVSKSRWIRTEIRLAQAPSEPEQKVS